VRYYLENRDAEFGNLTQLLLGCLGESAALIQVSPVSLVHPFN
jgi:hypothetical protein